MQSAASPVHYDETASGIQAESISNHDETACLRCVGCALSMSW